MDIVMMKQILLHAIMMVEIVVESVELKTIVWNVCAMLKQKHTQVFHVSIRPGNRATLGLLRTYFY